MHQILYLQEILLNIFGHCSPPGRRCNSDLPGLARTCRAFKDPALDILWEELFDLSPLARCLPEACQLSGKVYSFSRPLNEGEWLTLRGYTRRVWSIRRFSSPSLGSSLDRRAIMVIFTSAPLADPLFPNIRSLFWQDSVTLPVAHAAVPSLTALHFDHESFPLDPRIHAEFLDAVGERCPNMKTFRITYPPLQSLFAAISRQVCRWANLQYLELHLVTLSIDTVLRLPSVSTLTWLSVKVGTGSDDHTSHAFGSLCVSFANLASLKFYSGSLRSVMRFFSSVQLPVIKDLDITCSKYTLKQDTLTCWAVIQNACLSNSLSRFTFFGSGKGFENLTDLDKQLHPQLVLDDLLPYRSFGYLRTICVNLPWSAKLTDGDLLDLVSTFPYLENISINSSWGWRVDNEGGITLIGFVQLLRRCPSLHQLHLAIDTRTFTQIPCLSDVSYPPRGSLDINVLDSYISPRFVCDLATVFRMLKVGSLIAWTATGGARDLEGAMVAHRLWERVSDKMRGKVS